MRAGLIFLLLITIACRGLSLGVALSEYEARNKSDLIAHIEITATSAPPARLGTSTDQEFGRFRRVATAKVLTAVKGCNAGDTLSLNFDNGYACPNVIYQKEEECLVFLTKTDSGAYNTMNLYCGRFSVKAGQVAYFNLMYPHGQAPELTPLDTALDWLRTTPDETK